MVRKDSILLNPPKVKKSRGRPPEKLNAKMLLFVQEYMVDRCGLKAAIRAGYSDSNASATAIRLLKNRFVKEAIQIATEAQEERLELSADRTLLEINRLATFDIRRLYKADGSLIPIPELDDDMAACVKGVEFKKIGKEYVKEYKIWNKEPALVMMKDIQKLVKENADANPAESVEIEFVTVSARRPERGVA
jgi:phage terminase small subunit